MPEYTYLLDTRLSAAQQNALAQVRDAARAAGMTVFLAGGAVRDLTTGSSVRDLDFTVQGNALALAAALTERGGVAWGSHEPSRTLFFFFPGSVRVEVASARSETFPKPGQPTYTWDGMVDDLRRRDFTANAMALSLNEGSYGLLLDPLNGVADIEARQLRLVSNYAFIEDPSRLVRAVRLCHRLGWSLEERTATRYENAKEADNFDVVSPFLRGYELEEIAAEENALSILKKLDAEGWMRKLFAAWTAEKADVPALEDLHRNRIQLLMQGVSADLTAAHLEVLTGAMKDAERAQLKAAMVRPGLLAQWEGLDGAAKEFARLLTGKDAAAPSATWKLLHSHAAEPILWLAHTRKGGAVEAKFKNFFTVWPEAAKKVPVALMLEMRITPELPVYADLLQELFLQQIDGKLETDEQMRAFLEAYSPPAPPPPVTLRRTRSKKADGKSKRKGASRDDEDEDEDRPAARSDDEEDAEDPDDPVADLEVPTDDEDEAEDDEVQPVAVSALGAGRKLNLDKIDLSAVLGRIATDDLDDEDELADELADEPPSGGETFASEDTLSEDSFTEKAPASPTGSHGNDAKPPATVTASDAESKPDPAAGKRDIARASRKTVVPVKNAEKELAPLSQSASSDVTRGALPSDPLAPAASTASAAKETDAAPAKPKPAKPQSPAQKQMSAAEGKGTTPLKKSAVAAVVATALPAKSASTKSAPQGKASAPVAAAPAKKMPAKQAAPEPAPAKKEAPPAASAKKQTAPAKVEPASAKAAKKR